MLGRIFTASWIHEENKQKTHTRDEAYNYQSYPQLHSILEHDAILTKATRRIR